MVEVKDEMYSRINGMMTRDVFLHSGTLIILYPVDDIDIVISLLCWYTTLRTYLKAVKIKVADFVKNDVAFMNFHSFVLNF